MSRKALSALAMTLAVLTAALAAGCGGGGPRDPDPDEQAAIESRLDDYTQAFADGDAQGICDTFVPATVETLGGEKACVKAYSEVAKAQAEGGAPAIGAVEIDRIEIADDGSIARLYPVDAVNPIRFQPVDDEWYVVPPPAFPGDTPPADTSS